MVAHLTTSLETYTCTVLHSTKVASLGFGSQRQHDYWSIHVPLAPNDKCNVIRRYTVLSHSYVGVVYWVIDWEMWNNVYTLADTGSKGVVFNFLSISSLQKLRGIGFRATPKNAVPHLCHLRRCLRRNSQRCFSARQSLRGPSLRRELSISLE